MNLSSPLLFPPGRFWIIVKRQIPTPKNEASTKPRAASSLWRVVARKSCTVPAPSKPTSVAPTKMASGILRHVPKKPESHARQHGMREGVAKQGKLAHHQKRPHQPAADPEQHRTSQRIAKRRILEGEKPHRAIQQGRIRQLVDARSLRGFRNESGPNHDRKGERMPGSFMIGSRSVCTTSERMVSRAAIGRLQHFRREDLTGRSKGDQPHIQAG